MARLFFLILIIGTSCSSSSDSPQNVVITYQDTVSQRESESFDLQVRKYEDPKRQTWQDPKFVIEALGDINGKNIADIGSGTGYFTFQMAVPANKVIAIDIEQRFLNYIEDRKTEMYDRVLAKKIETRLTTGNTASLLPEEVDIVLMVNTIGYIENRPNYLKNLKEGIVSGGRIVIIDYKLGKMPVGPEDNLKVGQADVTKALEAAGFIIQDIDTNSLQYQYLIKASKP